MQVVLLGKGRSTTTESGFDCLMHCTAERHRKYLEKLILAPSSNFHDLAESGQFYYLPDRDVSSVVRQDRRFNSRIDVECSKTFSERLASFRTHVIVHS